ncbi:MAG: carboxypeptidase-like regulatory domain-containing protein [Planctomycetota bacterium]
MNARSFAVAALGLGVLAALAVWGLRPASEPPNPAVPAAGATTGTTGDANPATAPAVAAPIAGAATADRAALPARELAPTPPRPQGLRGRAVDGFGQPLADLPVHLVESAANEPLAALVLGQRGDVFQPVDSTTTAADGTFAVGLAFASAATYDLYVTSPAHATARLAGLAIVASRWHDVGDVTMAAGTTVRGTVTVAGRPDIPVAGAVVSLATGSVFADAPLRALPDAGQGLVATSGADGSYELRHVPTRGVVVASAVAAGFARLRKPNLDLRGDGPHVVDFALLPGQSIAGRVVDAQGAPLGLTRIEAWPTEAAGEPSIATSAADGSFEVLGLGLGKHGLRASRRGYGTTTANGVDSGARSVQLQLPALATARVRVVDAAGAPLRRFRLGLRRVFLAHGDTIAAVPEVADRSVQLGPTDDAAVLDGVPVGDFCVQVEADGFAKALSAPFFNPATAEAAAPRAFEVTVPMGPGATLRGRVVDERGAPLVGAVVRTLAAGVDVDGPFRRLLGVYGDTAPERITATDARTDADGWFTCERLALGDYQLLVDHPEACRGGVANVPLAAAGPRTLPAIVLPLGAIVAGRATVGGAPAPQMKVVLASATANGDAAHAVRLEAVTDPDGSFRMPRRVPPGAYELRAARTGAGSPEAHVVPMILQLQRTTIAVAVASGQRDVRADIDLPNDR